MNLIEQRREVFKNELIASGDRVKAYKTAYPNVTDETARVNSYRLLQDAGIRKELKDIQTQIRDKAIEQAVNQYSGKILSKLQKHEILYNIAAGGIFKDPETGINLPATIGERLKAIEIDNKMSGDNASEKHEHEHDIKGTFMSFLIQSSPDIEDDDETDESFDDENIQSF